MKKYFLAIMVFAMMVSVSYSAMNNMNYNIEHVKKIDLSSSRFDLAQPYWDESTFGYEQTKTEENQRRMIKAQPPIKMDDSLERKQINMRTRLWNDPYKIAYLYIFLEGHGCVGYFVIKGKVSSVNSTITNPEQLLRTFDDTQVVSAPAEDGSYGTNGDGIFAFTQAGGYMETNMRFLLLDFPCKISTVELGKINR